MLDIGNEIGNKPFENLYLITGIFNPASFVPAFIRRTSFRPTSKMEQIHANVIRPRQNSDKICQKHKRICCSCSKSRFGFQMRMKIHTGYYVKVFSK